MTRRSDPATQEIPDGLVALARIAAYHDRVILLCTAVVLRQPVTAAAMRRHITAWPGPARVKTGVLSMLDFLGDYQKGSKNAAA